MHESRRKGLDARRRHDVRVRKLWVEFRYLRKKVKLLIRIEKKELQEKTCRE